MKCYKFFSAVLLLLTAITAFAQSSPEQFVQTTSDQMIASLQRNKASLKNNPQVVYSIVRTNLLPKVDVPTMSRAVIGPVYWNKASSAEQNEFTQQFVNLLIRTYSSAFAQFNDETVRILPSRGGSGSQAQVRTLIVRKDGPSIPVNYVLSRSGGSWKVVDFSVEGVSMIQSFRSQFSSMLNQSGMSGLITKMKTHNQRKR